MTQASTKVSLDPAVAAQQRAMPRTRLVDCGMAPSDADRLISATAAGSPWADVARALTVRQADAVEAAREQGDAVTALEHARWAVGAALFAQMAEDEDTPRKRELYDEYVERVTRLAQLREPAVERLQVPYRDGHLVGWLCLPPSGAAQATVALWGGLTGWGAAYLGAAEALAARGLACLLVEGPGQGEPRLVDRLFVDEHVVDAFACFLDAIEAHPLLGGAIGVQGNSFGGLFAAHLAAQDRRVGACVVNGAPAAPELPPFRSARAQFAAAFGTNDEHDLGEALHRLWFDPGRDRIACPVLVLHGGADPLLPDSGAQVPFAEAAGSRGELRTWPDGEHTLYNHGQERDSTVADWFQHQLVPEPPETAVRPARQGVNDDH